MPASTTYIAAHAQRGLPVTAGRTALQRPRDYFDAALTHVRAGVGARKSRDEIVSLTALRGFHTYRALIPGLSLAATLGAAYDELTFCATAVAGHEGVDLGSDLDFLVPPVRDLENRDLTPDRGSQVLPHLAGLTSNCRAKRPACDLPSLGAWLDLFVSTCPGSFTT